VARHFCTKPAHSSGFVTGVWDSLTNSILEGERPSKALFYVTACNNRKDL
jgi:hypothetical protein